MPNQKCWRLVHIPATLKTFFTSICVRTNNPKNLLNQKPNIRELYLMHFAPFLQIFGLLFNNFLNFKMVQLLFHNCWFHFFISFHKIIKAYGFNTMGCKAISSNTYITWVQKVICKTKKWKQNLTVILTCNALSLPTNWMTSPKSNIMHNMLWALVFWKENVKTKMGLKLVPLVSTCFVERFGAPHQNLGFH